MLRRLKVIPILVVAAAACHKAEVTTAPGLSFTKNPCLGPDTVRLAQADTLRVDCSNGGTTVTFAGGGASYLVVPEFATDQAPFALVQYNMSSGALAGAPPVGSVVARVQQAAAQLGLVPQPRPMLAQNAMDQLLRSRGRALAAQPAFHAGFTTASSRPRIVAAPPALGSVKSFQVISSVGSSPTWATVGAKLTFIGNNILLYIDTLSPGGGLDSAHSASFGTYFDQTLYPIDTTAFGGPSDIDGNGHVVMLMSPTVNALTSKSTCSTQGYVAGFFNEEDFNATTSDPHSNFGEIFYSVVPDSAGTFSCAHSLSSVEFTLGAVFLHELQHLVSFSQHVVIGGGNPGASWLDEGMSIVAEELGSLYYEQKCPAPSCRTNPAQLFPDSSQGFIQGFLFDSYEYALLPDTASITLESDANLGDSWRGGSWLLVRWLVDQKGSGVLKALEHGPSDGVTAIEQASGWSFPWLFAHFGLALYTDSLPGLPRATAPGPDRFVSRNVKQLWARLYATTQQPSSFVPRQDPVQLFAITADTTTAVLYPGTVTYFRLDTPASSAAVSVRFSGPGGAAFSATLKPQIAIFRLPAGQ